MLGVRTKKTSRIGLKNFKPHFIDDLCFRLNDSIIEGVIFDNVTVCATTLSYHTLGYHTLIFDNVAV